MPVLFPLKNYFKEKTLFLNRTVIAGCFILVFFLILVSRLFFLQIIQHKVYDTHSRNNQVRVLPITPIRGLIFDRQGKLLAGNQPTFDLEIIPNQVKNLKLTVQKLSHILPISADEKTSFYKRIQRHAKHKNIAIKQKLTEAEVAKYMVNKHLFQGVSVATNLIRYYPHSLEFAHAIGYVAPMSEREVKNFDSNQYRSSHHVGKMGLEKFYETQLHGKIGYQHIETDARGRYSRILNTEPATPGTNLYLSLDLDLQKIIHKALGNRRGAVVALNPNTGDVLAFASTPSYDPNAFTQGMDHKTYKALQQGQNKPLFNRVILGQYPPGSTVKPLFALQALETGVISPHGRFFDPGWFQIPNDPHIYHNWKRKGHGWINLEMALYQSCSTFFYYIANRLGINALHDILTRFGVGLPLEIDIPGAAKGVAPSTSWKLKAIGTPWYPGETLSAGIGQGYVLATPLHMAQVAAAISQKGDRFKPHIVHALKKPFAQEYELIIPKPLPKAVIKNDQHWQLIHQAMRKTVLQPSGTAHRLIRGLTYSLAAKTGTSQVVGLNENKKYEHYQTPEHLRDHKWFIAFAPVDAPEIAICVLIENNKGAPDLARIVLDYYFKEMRDYAKN